MKKIIFIAIIVTLMLYWPADATAADERLDFVKQKLLDANIEQKKIDELFSDSRFRLLPAVSVSYKKPDWALIRKKLYARKSLQKGWDYIQANKETFDAAERTYGVPKEIIAGIIAIETDFGANVGRYSIFNALYSRLEQRPKETWRGPALELVALSKYCLSLKLDCYSIHGSYAGAWGLVQFMPSSVMAYGVDGDGDGIKHMLNPADAIPSAANFLVKHGWPGKKVKALTNYYGSSVGYPEIVLRYSMLLKKFKPK